MQDFQPLRVWQQGHELRLAAYQISSKFPALEQFVLTPQIRRSASSICWNIAEGCGRGSDLDFARSLQIGVSSAYEFLDQLIQARDLHYLPRPEFEEIASVDNELCRQMIRFMQYLRRNEHRKRR